LSGLWSARYGLLLLGNAIAAFYNPLQPVSNASLGPFALSKATRHGDVHDVKAMERSLRPSPRRPQSISEKPRTDHVGYDRRRRPAPQQRPFPALGFRCQYATLGHLLLALIDETFAP
jgi:hypothetical protein